MRMTKEVIQQLLDQNEGFKRDTTNNQKNITEYGTYRISSGQLYIRSYGKTSWAEGRFDNEGSADAGQTRRFLREYLGYLNTDGLE